MNNPMNEGHTKTHKHSPKLGEQYTRHGTRKQCYVYNKGLGVQAIPNMANNCMIHHLTMSGTLDHKNCYF